jgi:GNAT superfamily N-acetyltransferase
MPIIRAATIEDWPRMQEVFCAAGRAAWPHILPSVWLETLNAPDRWREAITDANRIVLFAESDGFAILCATDEPGVGELDSFYVHPDVWGQGVGRSLLAASVGALRDMGFTEAKLWTAELNHRPRRVYETAGWELEGTSRVRSLANREFVELRYRIGL